MSPISSAMAAKIKKLYVTAVNCTMNWRGGRVAIAKLNDSYELLPARRRRRKIMQRDQDVIVRSQ